MKKIKAIVVTIIRIVIWSIIGIFTLPIALIINAFHGVSPLATFQSLWFAVQIGKEENEEES